MLYSTKTDSMLGHKTNFKNFKGLKWDVCFSNHSGIKTSEKSSNIWKLNMLIKKPVCQRNESQEPLRKYSELVNNENTTYQNS